MSNWHEIKNNLVNDVLELAKGRPYPKIWALGVCLSIIASLCYYDSANTVRVSNKLKQLRNKKKDSGL